MYILISGVSVLRAVRYCHLSGKSALALAVRFARMTLILSYYTGTPLVACR